MKKLLLWLALIGLSMLSACTPWDVVNEIAASGRPNAEDLNINELYWDAPAISATSCPEIDGEFLAPTKGVRWMENFLMPVLVVKRINGEWIGDPDGEVKVSVKSMENGVWVRVKTTVDDGTKQFRYGSHFGCVNGEYVVKGQPHYGGGGEGSFCHQVNYIESHWKLDKNGDLVATTTQRNPCWLDRGNVPKRQYPITTVYKRVGASNFN